MIKLMVNVVLVATLIACNNNSSGENETNDSSSAKTDSSANSQANSDGWQNLFDGESTKGWHKYGGAPVGAAWKISDKTIYFDTAASKESPQINGGDIVTDQEFENFHLKLEWKIAPGGNSGIMFNVNEDTMKFKRSYESGPEMQVVDNERHPDGKLIKHQAGDLYDLIACSKKTVKPAGEWNEAEIKLVNGKLDLYLNGENVVSTTMWDDSWNKMVARSKFKEWPGFGTFKKGRICLQDHGDMVWYRNIRVKAL